MASQPEISTLTLTLALALPPVVILAIWWGVRKVSQSKEYDPKTGIGKGAPGFTTNVRKVAVPPEIMARIRAGEQVSGEEITAAQEKMKREEEKREKGESNTSGVSEESEAAPKKKKKGSKRK